MTRQEYIIGKEMSKIILDVITKDGSIKAFCEENHIARERMTSNFLMLNNGTTFRTMMGVAQAATLEDYLTMCLRIAFVTYYVAHLEDGTPEAIKKAHEGSPIGKKREKKSKITKKSSTSKINDENED